MFKALQTNPESYPENDYAFDEENGKGLNSDFTVLFTPDQIHVNLHDNEGHPVISDERRVHFTVLSGGKLLKYQGHMGGSDVIETANGRAWIHIMPDADAEEMTVSVEVDGIGAKEETITIERT